MFDRKQTKIKSVPKRQARGKLEQTKRSNKPNAKYTKDSRADNRRPSADQWQCTQRVVVQTNRRPMAVYTQDSGADQPQTNGNVHKG